jgi:hypothetical protein
MEKQGTVQYQFNKPYTLNPFQLPPVFSLRFSTTAVFHSTSQSEEVIFRSGVLGFLIEQWNLNIDSSTQSKKVIITWREHH